MRFLQKRTEAIRCALIQSAKQERRDEKVPRVRSLLSRDIEDYAITHFRDRRCALARSRMAQLHAENQTRTEITSPSSLCHCAHCLPLANSHELANERIGRVGDMKAGWARLWECLRYEIFSATNSGGALAKISSIFSRVKSPRCAPIS